MSTTYNQIEQKKNAIIKTMDVLLQSNSFLEFRHWYLSNHAIEYFQACGIGRFKTIAEPETMISILGDGFSQKHFEKFLQSVTIDTIKKDEITDFLQTPKAMAIMEKWNHKNQTDYEKVGVLNTLLKLWKKEHEISNDNIHHRSVRMWMDMARTSLAIQSLRNDPEPLLKEGDLLRTFKKATQNLDATTNFRSIFIDTGFVRDPWIPADPQLSLNAKSGARSRTQINRNNKSFRSELEKGQKHLQDMKFQPEDGISTILQEYNHKPDREIVQKLRNEFYKNASAREVLATSTLFGGMFDESQSAWVWDSSKDLSTEYYYRSIFRTNPHPEYCIPPWVMEQRYVMTQSEKTWNPKHMAHLLQEELRKDPLPIGNKRGLPSELTTMEEAWVQEYKQLMLERIKLDPDFYHRIHPKARNEEMELTAILANPSQLLDPAFSVDMPFILSTLQKLDPTILKKLDEFRIVHFHAMGIPKGEYTNDEIRKMANNHVHKEEIVKKKDLDLSEMDWNPNF